MEIKEEWKDVIGYEGLYQVSNFGNIKSLERYSSCGRILKEKIMKPYITKKGYLRINLNGKKYLIHRLVSSAFLPNPQKLPQIDHIDGNKQNNCVNNLRWVTNKENCNNPITLINYSKANKIKNKGRKQSQEHIEKRTNCIKKPILQFNREGTKIIGKWDSVREVERKLNIKNSNIIACCKGKYKKTGGFKFMYLEDYINRMEKLYQMTLKKAS